MAVTQDTSDGGGADPLHREVAELIVTTLNLEISADQIEPDQTLFGDQSVLGLDSIDALEIALVIEHRYGAKISAEDEDNDKRFASIRALSDFIRETRKLNAAVAAEVGD